MYEEEREVVIMNNDRKFKVFISYSWDSVEHRQKVKEFVHKLRLAHINVIYDNDMVLGDRITAFIEGSICDSDIVLLICTPQYKRKADTHKGGVGYENTIITGELFESENERKFIPVLFSGSWSESLPNWAKGKLGIDLSNSETYSLEVNKLIQVLSNNQPHKIASEPEHRLASVFEAMRNSMQPIYAQSEAEADFIRRQAAGLTSSAEDAFGF